MGGKLVTVIQRADHTRPTKSGLGRRPAVRASIMGQV